MKRFIVIQAKDLRPGELAAPASEQVARWMAEALNAGTRQKSDAAWACADEDTEPDDWCVVEREQN